jgi:hypothetical protein
MIKFLATENHGLQLETSSKLTQEYNQRFLQNGIWTTNLHRFNVAPKEEKIFITQEFNGNTSIDEVNINNIKNIAGFENFDPRNNLTVEQMKSLVIFCKARMSSFGLGLVEGTNTPTNQDDTITEYVMRDKDSEYLEKYKRSIAERSILQLESNENNFLKKSQIIFKNFREMFSKRKNEE